jgi:predicted MFS family arabinose efflux permease
VTANLFGTSWRPVFLVNVPIGLVVMILVPRLVPRDGPGSVRRLDVIGLLVAVPAVFLVVLPLMLRHAQGWPAWTFACIACGVALGAVFIFTERRVADPLLNLAVLRAPGLRTGLATTAIVMVTYGGFLFSFALHLQSGLGDSALRAGLTFAPCAVAFGLGGYFWRRLPSASHPVLPPVGCLVAAAGYAAVTLVLRSGTSGGAVLQVFLVLLGAMLALAFSPLVTHSLVHVPVSQAADASGLVTTTMQLSQAVGVATFGSLFLTLDSRAVPAVSGHAIAVTLAWVAVAMVVGVLTGASLSRTVAAAAR